MEESDASQEHFGLEVRPGEPYVVMVVGVNGAFMNVDYVSKQFYKQTGEKFSAWLNRQRIEKAKELLLNCDTEKIYTVAEAVGCGNNPQYFSQLFKKYTGMSPTEYIRKLG